jgi:hypothetical protein
VPPGIVDATAPNPVFSLTPSATVDEGNNWVNVSFGPLALSDDSLTGGAQGNYGGGLAFGNYALNTGSTAMDYIPCSNTGATTCTVAPVAGLPSITLPPTDFFGNQRPDAVGDPSGRHCNPDPGNGHACVDVGAIESRANGPGLGTASFSAPSPALTSTPANTTTKTGTITVRNTATGANAGPITLVAAPSIATVGTAVGTFSITGGTCVYGAVINPNPGSNCTIIVQYVPGTSTATATANVTVTGTGLATGTATSANFTAN